jgi:cyclopropane-fatty-acyl-phospholipid synthase
MSSSAHPGLSTPIRHAAPADAPLPARALLRLLERLAIGRLDVQWPDGSMARFGSAAAGAPQAAIQLSNWKPCAAALRSGDIGFAEGYIAGDWHTPDLPALLRLLVANRDAIAQAVYGHWWGSLLHRVKHLLNRNSRAGSRKNVHAHYDLGNAFYRLWLDETMNYSSAWFDGDASQPLAAAQHAKVRRALDTCGVQPGQRLLEMGCGWGAVAEAAVARGAWVTGLTLSSEQLEWAQARVPGADLRLQDYRDLRGEPFDALVSIEMFEAVGLAYWPQFFEAVKRHLKPGGRACIQSITIRDDLFDRYVDGTDFIQQYIFPGGLLPSRSAFRQAAWAAGLDVVDELAFGADYAHTLACWRERFHAQEAAVRALGFDFRFIRTWEFYLAYCEAAFAGANTDVVQFTLRRPA